MVFKFTNHVVLENKYSNIWIVQHFPSLKLRYEKADLRIKQNKSLRFERVGAFHIISFNYKHINEPF